MGTWREIVALKSGGASLFLIIIIKWGTFPLVFTYDENSFLEVTLLLLLIGCSFRCYFSKAKCQNFNMNIEYFGICGAGVAVTDSLFLLTESPSTTEAVTTSTVSEDTTTVDEEELMRQVFCSNVNDISCDDDVPHWYCGSNNVMYKNEWVFQ